MSPNVKSLVEQIGFNSEMIFTSPLVSALTGITMNIEIQKRVLDLLIVSGVTVIPLVIASFVTNVEEKLKTFKES